MPCSGYQKHLYAKYLKRANTMHSGASDALPEHSNQAAIDRYLYGYFELQSMALEIAGIQFANAQMQLLQGAPKADLSRKKVTKMREQMYNGRKIYLTDTTTTELERYVRGAPRLPKNFLDLDDFQPGVENLP